MPAPPPHNEEQTPLLADQSTSPSSSSASKPSPSSPSISSSISTPDSPLDDAPEYSISTVRASLVLSSLVLLVFLQASNISMITTTQSAIAADLDAFEQVNWFASAYLIAMSSMAPLMGRLSQVFSPRSCIFACSLILTVGVSITAAAPSFAVFILGRVVTGVGGAGLLTVAIILIIQLSGPKHRGILLGIANSTMTLGVSLGAIVAGALEPRIGWKSLYGIQAPFTAAAGTILFLSLPSKFFERKGDVPVPLRQKLRQVDYLGAITLTATITLFLLGLSGPQILPLPILLALLLTLPLFLWTEVRHAHLPILPVAVLLSRGTLLTSLASLGMMMARWAILFYAPVYAIAVRDWSPGLAGTVLIPTNLGFALGGLLAGALHIRRPGSFYLPALLATALFPLTLLAVAWLSTPTAPTPAYLAALAANGLATGAVLNYTLVHLLHLVRPALHPLVLALLATFRGFAGSFGAAVGGGLFLRLLRPRLREGLSARAGLPESRVAALVRQLVGSPALVARLEGPAKEVAVESYVAALRGLFLAAVALSAVVVLLQAGTGWKGWVERRRPGSGDERGEEEEDEEEEEEEEAAEALGGAS